MAEPLLDSAFLAKLERLTLANRMRLASIAKGERRSREKGASVNFADYRAYVAGDELERIDWNIYGRLDTLVLKQFEDEEQLTAHLLVDVSPSMDWGTPNKRRYAAQLAAALGYIALCGMERLSVSTFAGDLLERYGPARGAREMPRLLKFLEREPAGPTATNFTAALGRYARQRQRSGLAILVSDLLSPEGYQKGLSSLLATRYEVGVIHLLAPQEIEPPMRGDLRLRDRETGDAVEVTLNQRAIDLYRQRFAAWCAEIESFCTRHRVLYHRVSTATDLEDLVFLQLRRKGFIQ